MKNSTFIMSWNNFDSDVRTNNTLERKNGSIKQLFGVHPYISKWCWQTAKLFEDGFVEMEQYITNGSTRVRSRENILREVLLKKHWEYISNENNQNDNDILSFLKETSIILKAKEPRLRKMYKHI